jgi:hypothetical protein
MTARDSESTFQVEARPKRRETDELDRDFVGMLQADVWSVAAAAVRLLGAFAAADTARAAGCVLVMLLSAAMCAAAIVVGWGLVVASLLYVVADYSTTAWLLTALGFAAAHAVLALFFWHHAARLGRRLMLRAERPERAP